MPNQASDLAAPLPNAEPTDSEQVQRCLEQAQALWQDGQHREAVRALQRGAEAAEEDGNDLRALSLARSAADLSAHAAPSVMPPADVDVEVDVVGPLPASGSLPVEAPVEPASPSAPAASPAPLGASGAASGSSGASLRPAPAASSAPRRATGSTAATFKRPAGSSSVAGEAAAKAAPGNGAPLPTARTEREIRVAVRRSNLDEDLYVVRPLRPGAKPPYGAEEALLVFRDAETTDKEP